MEQLSPYRIPTENLQRLAFDELRSIFGSLFAHDQYLNALSLCGYDSTLAAEYLQDHLQEQKLSETPDTEADSIELGNHSYDASIGGISEFREVKKGVKLVLEFSRSPEYTGEGITRLYVTDEALCSIFIFLDPEELGRCAMVCKSWAFVEAKCKNVYKQACLLEFKNKVSRPPCRFPSPFNASDVLWGPEFPDLYCANRDYIQSFKTWKRMWTRRPRIKTYGIYISKTRYWRQGASVPGNSQTAHLVEFYRYLRFSDDFSVICMTTAKKPSYVIPTFSPEHPDVRNGEYATNKKKVIAHLCSKDTMFSYIFKICSTTPGRFDVLKLETCITRDLRTLEESEISTAADSFPKLYKFFKFKSRLA